MSSRNYRLYGTGTATASALTSIKFVRKGTIKAIRWSTITAYGAAIDTRITHELSKQSVSTLAANDCPPTCLGVMTDSGTTIASASLGTNKLDIVDFPVDAGETVYIHMTVSGTAPTTHQVYCDLCVQE